MLIVAPQVDKSSTAYPHKDLILGFFLEWEKHATYFHNTSSAINTKYWDNVMKNILQLPATDNKEQRLDHAREQ